MTRKSFTERRQAQSNLPPLPAESFEPFASKEDPDFECLHLVYLDGSEVIQIESLSAYQRCCTIDPANVYVIMTGLYQSHLKTPE